MNRFLLSLSVVLFALPSLAQLDGDKYYRVQNFESSRFITLIDNKAQPIPATSTKPDLLALNTVKPQSKVIDDPASILFIQHISGNEYNLKSQGCDAHAFAGRYIKVRKATNLPTYYAWGEAAGVEVYLYDEPGNSSEGVVLTGGDEGLRRWKILPVSATSDNFFGVTPEFTVDGQRYTSLYASFPFTFYSNGMKAYTVTKVDRDLAVWQEVEGKVAASTPVILACAGSTPSDNKLNIELTDGNKPSNNLLKGVYFMNLDVERIAEDYEYYLQGDPYFPNPPFHLNVTPYDPNTMRLLGTTSEGKLGFIKADVQYLPRNRAYLTVPAGSPDEITLVSQAEYDAIVAADAVTITATNYSREYGEANPSFEYTVSGTGTLKGSPVLSCEATQSSPVGTYPIVVGKGSITNRKVTLVNGNLTVTAAPLTVTARSYTIKQNENVPKFDADYAGFKNGETSTVLTAQPIFTCEWPADKTPGTYPITVNGCTAQNYTFTYVAGTLTILQADPITVTVNSVSRPYGDANPQLTYTVSGGTITGTPVLSTEANLQSPVGEYDITIEAGTINYPNLQLVPGKLTVTPAMLTVNAGTYTMKQTDPRPEFVASYSGWKNDETVDIITSQPVFATTAPDDNTPGEYEVTVSGVTAPNYDVTYVPGKLVIREADQLLVLAADATMIYGDDLPQFSYTIEGAEGIEVQGEPVISTQASKTSSVGTYDIIVERGTLTWPNIKFVSGKLTISKAPLTASVGNYTMQQFDPLPKFEIVYTGWRNDDDDSVLILHPVATTTATSESEPGVYEITVAGGVAQNYEFTYVGGQLTIEVPSAVTSLTFRHPVDVYTITGRKVRSQVTTIQGLTPGVYIVEGRKLIVR